MSKGKDHIKLTEAIRLAIKWAAPETIKGLRLSEASDCWSVGVTITEIFAKGDQPWPGVSNAGVVLAVSRGKMQEKPKVRQPYDSPYASPYHQQDAG